MPFTAGSIFGKLEGQSHANNTLSAFNSSNSLNPNQNQARDIFQILAPGGACLLQVTAAYVVNTNVAAGSFTTDTVLEKFQMTTQQFKSLPATPTASQICQAALPLNFANQQLDLIQIESDIAVVPSGVLGGGSVVWRLLFNGSTATS